MFHAVCGCGEQVAELASSPRAAARTAAAARARRLTPFIHASHFGSVSASFFENCAIES